MGAVYKNATITIIAAISPDVNTGFLSHKSSKPQPVRLPLLLPGDNFGTLNVYPREIKVAQEPLYLRAWALQELLLSERSLIFGEEVRWDCRSVGELNGDPRSNTLLPSNTWYVPASLARSSRIWDKMLRLKGNWKSIAMEYSKRKLTYVEDRFVAIAAVAKALQQEEPQEVVQDTWGPDGSSYFAGCWRKSFIVNLCWQRRYDAGHSSPSYQLVTWSWISIGLEIEFRSVEAVGFPDEYNKAEILGCVISSEPDNDPFGNITAAELRIRGPLVRLDSDTYHRLFGTLCTNLSLDLTSEIWKNDVETDQGQREALSRKFIEREYGGDDDKSLFVLMWPQERGWKGCGLIVKEFKTGHFIRSGFLSFFINLDTLEKWYADSRKYLSKRYRFGRSLLPNTLSSRAIFNLRIYVTEQGSTNREVNSGYTSNVLISSGNFTLRLSNTHPADSSTFNTNSKHASNNH